MAATNTTASKAASGDGFSAQERAAMKERAAELRAEGKKGAKKADGQEALLEAIAKMAPDDRALAERVHVAISANAPELEPKTWYGMPAWANAEGKTAKNRMHIDIRVAGEPPWDPVERDRLVHARVAELVAAGATRVREELYDGELGHGVMLDPEGNEFCVA